MQNAIDWFEIPVSDIQRASTFYSSIFDVKMEPFEMMGAMMSFFPLDDPNGSGVGGSLVLADGYTPSQQGGATLYLNANPDLNTVLDRVTSAGGAVLMSKTLISDENGYMAFFMDSEGNRVGLHSMS